MAIQLDLFEPTETTILLEEIRKVKTSSDAVRRSVFARITEFEKTIKDIRMIIKEETKNGDNSSCSSY